MKKLIILSFLMLIGISLSAEMMIIETSSETIEIDLMEIENIEFSGMTDAELIEVINQINFKLNQNFPNPFNPSTTISFNLSEAGKDKPADDPQKNPDIIIGTSNMDISKWEPLIRKFEDSFKSADYFGTKLDVRRNIKYPGGFFARWIHNNFPKSACVISLEFKKIFMDEWTGKLDEEKYQNLKSILMNAKSSIEKINLI